MAFDLKVNYSKCDDAKAAYVAAKEKITVDYIASFKVKASLDYDADAQIITAVGRGFKLLLRFADDHCTVESKFSLILRAIKGKVMSILEKELKGRL